jgi:DNA uptake protein ComE-like DNA-binding protein
MGITGTIGTLIITGSAIATGLLLSRRILLPGQSTGRSWQDPRYRFRSVLELQQAVRQGFRLEVATASVDDWLRLPLFSIHQAHLLTQLQRSGVALHCMEDLATALEVPIAQIEPLRQALQFTYYDATSPLNCPKLNPSQAEPAALLGVPGLDERLVKRIVNDRNKRGAYRDLADFQARLQLSGDRIEDLMYYLTFL